MAKIVAGIETENIEWPKRVSRVSKWAEVHEAAASGPVGQDFVIKIHEDESHKAENAAVSLQDYASERLTDIRLKVAAREGQLFVRKEKLGTNGKPRTKKDR
ncbi:MAG: hypothetical protein IIA89_14670 [Chloroflexi bacterium]|nr:hypothetical protein [Chloroflexota bacterium]